MTGVIKARLAPQRRIGRRDRTTLITQPRLTVPGKQQRPIKIDETRKLRNNHSRRHRK